MNLRRREARLLVPMTCLLALLLVCQGVSFGQATDFRPRSGSGAKSFSPSPAAQARHARFIQQIIEPNLEIRIDPTRSKLIRTKLPVTRIAITDPAVLDINQYSATEFEIIGRKSGKTTLTIWFGAADQGQNVLRYLVHVEPDHADQQRAETEYNNLQRRVNEMFPNSQIQLIPIADKLFIRGQARDSQEATHIMALVSGKTANQAGAQANGSTNINPVSRGTVAAIPGAADLPEITVISLLHVPGEQQVMLKVRIAELTRSALRELGVDFEVMKDSFSIASAFGGASNITAILDNDDVSLFIKAFSSNAHSKILAEPTFGYA